MAALLVGMAVAAILMTAALPTWRQMVRREREAELIFRGQQYVRAITLFQRKSGPGTLPPDLDTLVNGRFLRKKFKDPITNDDFDLLSPAQSAGGTGAAAPGGAGTQAQAGRGGQQPTTTGAVIAGQAPGGRGAVGGIIGVASKSKDASIRIYNGRAKYNEWQFLFVPQQAPAGAGAGGAQGQRGVGPGGTPQFPTGFPGIGGGRQGGAGGRGTPPPAGGRGGPQGPAPNPAGGGAPSPFAPRGR